MPFANPIKDSTARSLELLPLPWFEAFKENGTSGFLPEFIELQGRCHDDLKQKALKRRFPIASARTIASIEDEYSSTLHLDGVKGGGVHPVGCGRLCSPKTLL